MLPTSLLAFSLGPTEILIIVGVVIVFFGGSKIPALMRSIGRAGGEFKQGMREAKPKD